MGVFTSSQILKKDKNAGVVMGNAKGVSVLKNAETVEAYKFPTPIQGEAQVPLNVGDTDKDDNPINTQVKLKDGVFTIPKSWKKTKKAAYREALLKIGFEDVSYSPEAPVKESEPEKSYIYYAGHPDNTDDEKVNGAIFVDCNGGVQELEVLDGVVVTEDKDIYQALLAKGYYEAKPAEEIKD